MYNRYIKRLIDIIISLAVMPLFALIFVFVVILIKTDDGGPIFYNALRCGRNGKPFRMYKFRSMKVNAPDMRNADGSTYSSDDDPRLTKTGRFLRKTSLDETPQLINILKGDMSIVGPRPTLATRDYATFDDIRKKRVSVRPGVIITTSKLVVCTTPGRG